MRRALRCSLLLTVLVAGCGPEQPGQLDDLHSDQGALKNLGDASGRWEGTADVIGTDILKTGRYPAVIHLVQTGTRVRGVLDINSNAAEFAEWLGYYFEGTLSAGVMRVELTDRACGAGEPEGLCYPNWDSKRKVFVATFELRGTERLTALTARSIAVRDGVSYPEGRTLELPFAKLKATRADAVQGRHTSLVGSWSGRFNPPESVVFGGLRMFGTNRLTFATVENAVALTRFDNNGRNIYPAFDDLILADTFRYDPSTRRFWFVEAGTIYGTYLWVGEMRGDVIVGQVMSDDPASPLYSSQKQPIDPFDAPFLNFEATFILRRDLAR